MLASTSALVLRTIKYGDSGLISTLYTRRYGLQSYLLQGIRSSRKQEGAGMYQPGMLLQAEVYHTPNKNLQRIREAHVAYYYQHIPGDILRTGLVLFFCEVLFRCIQEPEPNDEWFDFIDAAFRQVDVADAGSLRNMAVWFCLQWARHMGFGFQNTFSATDSSLDLQNGRFCTHAELESSHFIEGDEARYISEIYPMPVVTGTEAAPGLRQQALHSVLWYLRLHIPHLGTLKSVDVLHDLLR
ncbi:MAG: DNA repair protein RecO [Chitinophagaceae bacterium]|nr:DNA repair protein RecO [Chitinophagaceae bacterium]